MAGELTTLDFEEANRSMLDRRQDEIIAWMMAGRSYASIADEIGCATSTVSRWAKRRDVAAAVEATRQDALMRVVRSATTAATISVTTLVQCLQSDTATWRDKVGAATALLKMVGVERLASSVDANTEAVAADTQTKLRGRVDIMLERAKASAEPADGPKLSIVEGGDAD